MTAQNPPQPTPPGRRIGAGSLLALILLAGLVARAGVAVYLGDVANPVSGAHDQYSYDALAVRVVQGHGFSFATGWYPFTQPDEPTAHWSFLYTLYLAAVYFVAGHHPLLARLVQVAASVLMLWLIYRLGRRLFGEWAGLAAAALAACYAYFVFFAAALMTQTFYITAVLASLAIALHLAEQPTRRGWLLLGLVLGVGTLMRQTLLLFAPLLVLWIWQGHRAAGRTASPAGPVLAAVVVVLCIAPFTVRNYLVFNDFLLLNSNGGYWLYSSNHPDQGTTFDSAFAAPLPEHLQGLSEPAIDRALTAQGLRFIIDEPGRYVQLTLSRFESQFWMLPSAQSSLLSNLGRMLSFPIYVPFMLYGLWLSRRHWRQSAPLYLYVAFDTVFCLLTWANPRYRLPSDAVMMVFAGLAVATLLQRFAPAVTARLER